MPVIYRELEQVGHAKLHAPLARRSPEHQPVGLRIPAPLLDQGMDALHAQHLPRPGGQRQREIAQSAEQVHHPVIGLHVQHLHRA